MSLFTKNKAQATVEAAFIIPVFFLGLLLLIQPAILLYDKIIMESAAAEACRTFASNMNSEGYVKDLVTRRLGAIPQQDNFHIHSAGCSYKVECLRLGENRVGVKVTNELKPLPLLDFTSGLIGATNGNGNFEISVQRELQTQSTWVSKSNAGDDQSQWPGKWLKE